MRFGIGHFALFALCVALPAAATAQEFDTRPGMAVFPFTNGGSFGPDREDLAALEVGIQQMLLTELAQNENLRIVERSQLRAILEEQGLVTSGRVDPRTAAQVGRLVGARYVITGVFMDVYGTFRLDARVVDVETGEVLKTEEVRDRRQNIYQLLVDMAGRITQGVSLPPLEVAMAEQRRARAIPAEAVTLFSRAQVYQDGGRHEQAIELYRQIAQRFPEMTEAREALQQLTGG
jgi:TolB-like protein